MLDGLFQQALLAYGDAGEESLSSLSAAVGDVMPLMLTPRRDGAAAEAPR